MHPGEELAPFHQAGNVRRQPVCGIEPDHFKLHTKFRQFPQQTPAQFDLGLESRIQLDNLVFLLIDPDCPGEIADDLIGDPSVGIRTPLGRVCNDIGLPAVQRLLAFQY